MEALLALLYLLALVSTVGIGVYCSATETPTTDPIVVKYSRALSVGWTIIGIVLSIIVLV